MHEVYWLTRGDVAFFEKGVQLGPGRRRQRIRWRSVSKGEKETRGERGGSRENKENREGGRGSGRQRSGLVGGAGRLLSEDNSMGEERPIEGLQGAGEGGLDEGASHVLLKERAGENKEKCRKQERGTVRELDPEEFALHSERIGGATRLAEVRSPPWVI